MDTSLLNITEFYRRLERLDIMLVLTTTSLPYFEAVNLVTDVLEPKHDHMAPSIFVQLALHNKQYLHKNNLTDLNPACQPDKSAANDVCD